VADAKSKDESNSEDDDDSSKIVIVLFKSDTCAFCPRAEEVVRDTIQDFSPDSFHLRIVNVGKNPEVAEEFGIVALPTTMIGGVSITGIPEPEMLMKMIMGAGVSKMRGGKK
jgi:thiol-disulfide isomerase/thioredoxin